MNHTFAVDVQDAVFVQVFCPERIKRTVEQLICMFRDGRPDAEGKTDYSDQWLGARLFGSDAISKSSESLRAKGRAARLELCEWQTANKITFATFFMGGMTQGEKVQSQVYLPVLDLIICVKDALEHRRFGPDRMRTEILKTVKNNLHLITDRAVRVDLVARRSAAFEVRNSRKANAPFVATQKFVGNMLAQNLDPRAAVEQIMTGEAPENLTVLAQQNQQVTCSANALAQGPTRPTDAAILSDKQPLQIFYYGELMLEESANPVEAQATIDATKAILSGLPDTEKNHHNMNNEYGGNSDTLSNGENSVVDALNNPSFEVATANHELDSVEPMEADPHRCHWPECKTVVLPKMWGCQAHWFALPKELRDRIWQSYRPGQEISKRPSPAYIEAAKAVRQWIEENYFQTEEKPTAAPDFPQYVSRHEVVDRSFENNLIPLAKEFEGYTEEGKAVVIDFISNDAPVADPYTALEEVIQEGKTYPAYHHVQHLISEVPPHCPDCQRYPFETADDWLTYCEKWFPNHAEVELLAVWEMAKSWVSKDAPILLIVLLRAKKESGIKPVRSDGLL